MHSICKWSQSFFSLVLRILLLSIAVSLLITVRKISILSRLTAFSVSQFAIGAIKSSFLDYMELGYSICRGRNTNSKMINVWPVRPHTTMKRNGTSQSPSPVWVQSGNIFWWAKIVQFHMYSVLLFTKRSVAYRKISWSLKDARRGFRIFPLFWHLTGTSAAVLPGCLSNCRAMPSV